MPRKLFDEFTYYAHGVPFKVRYVHRDRYLRIWPSNLPRYVVFAPDGRFLCRINRRDFLRWKPWLFQQGLRYLREGWKCQKPTIGNISKSGNSLLVRNAALSKEKLVKTSRAEAQLILL